MWNGGSQRHQKSAASAPRWNSQCHIEIGGAMSGRPRCRDEMTNHKGAFLMKKFVLVLIVMLFVVGAQAQQRQLLSADVPFSFMVENDSFPAGSYTMDLVNP